MRPEEGVAAGILGEVLAAGACRIDEAGSTRLLWLIEEYLRWSRRMHIVGKVDAEGALAAQIVESLLMLDFMEDIRSHATTLPGAAGKVPHSGRIADIGSGHGFPALVWKAARKDLLITLIERKEKAAAFLELLTAKMGAPGIETICADAAKAATDGIFSVVTSKAAGRFGALLPIAERLLVPGGMYITVKGAGWEDEMEGIDPGGMVFLEARNLPGGAGAMVAFIRKG